MYSRQNRSWGWLLTSLFLLSNLSGIAFAASFEVHPGESIQAAIDAASDGDSVLVHPGEYLGPMYENMSFDGKAIVVRSLAGPAQTIIGGDWYESGFRFESGEGPGSVLEGFKIRHAWWGIYCDNASPRLSQLIFEQNIQGLVLENWSAPLVFLCDFIENDASHPGGCCGAALYCDSSTPLFSSCLFQYNYSEYGGAALVINGSNPRFQNVVFSDNGSAEGGAVLIVDSQCSFESVDFTRNRASSFVGPDFAVLGRGGAIYCKNGSLSLDDVSFTDNQCTNYLPPSPGAGSGGALHLESTDCVFTGGLLAGNGSWDEGAAIYLISGSWLDMSSATVTNNEPGQGGSSIYVESSTLFASEIIASYTTAGVGIFGGDQSAALVLSCSDVYGNEYGDYGGSFADPTGSNGNISEDPRFCDASAEDYTLAEGSPCLPSGNACSILMGYFDLGCGGPTAIPQTVPAIATMLRNNPNPFNPSTAIKFSLARGTELRLTIHDTAGALVATLANGVYYAAGNHKLIWHGRNDAGEFAPSGLYFCRLHTESSSVTIKLTLLK